LTFETGFRNARTARNPQTGAEIQVAATHTAKVSAGSNLKAAAQKNN
jgi:DNA-binding protein HU-beta